MLGHLKKTDFFCSKSIKTVSVTAFCIIFNRNTVLIYFMLCAIHEILVLNYRHERGEER